MSSIPDPALVEATAARLNQHAAAVRDRATHLRRASDGCQWDGHAARAFRHEAAAVVGVLHRSAAQLEDAARALRRHAGDMRDELRKVEHEMRGVAELLGVRTR